MGVGGEGMRRRGDVEERGWGEGERVRRRGYKEGRG